MVAQLVLAVALVLAGIGLTPVAGGPAASASPTGAVVDVRRAAAATTASAAVDGGFAARVLAAEARSAVEPQPADDVTVTDVDVVLPSVVDGKVVPEAHPAQAAPGTLMADTLVADPAGPGGAAGSSADRLVSDVYETGGFQTLGVTWPTGTDASGLDPEVRTRSDGQWSAWQTLGAADDGPDVGTPDAQRSQRDGTDSLWVGEADAVQVSFAATGSAPDDLGLTLVDVPATPPATASNAVATGGGPAADALYTTVSTPLTPKIITREEWGARPQACQPDVASTLVGAVVHHTAGSNNYSTIAEAERQIRGDQAYHIDGRGWCDIGYNFVVDKWGNIYEGRDDSLTKAVIGVHAGGFNTGTLGVSMLGTYDSAPPAATQRSVAQIIGYRLGYYGVNPEGTMSYHTYGGENSRIPADTTVTLPRVMGHRDVAYTACPGNGGYAALPAIRAMAASYSFDQRFVYARAVVKAMYQDLLGRGVDPSGLESWSAMLVGGSGLPALVDSLTSSEEYIKLRIRQAYLDVLGRGPEAAGMDFWYKQIRAGDATVDDVARRFYDSDEYFERSGGTAEGYVALLYATVLGRPASDAEAAYWADLISTWGRGVVVDAIWFSHEAAMRRAGAYYQTFVQRAPDAGGQEFWAGVLLDKGEGAVRIGIAGSAEYGTRAQARFPESVTAG